MAAAILAVLIGATPPLAQTVLPEPREAVPDAPVVLPPPPPAVEYAPVPPPPPAVEYAPAPSRSRAPEPRPPGSATDANRFDAPTETLKKAGEVIQDLAKGDVKALRRGPLLIHGNYCGIGNKPGVPPVDALDAACMRHDACTPNGGVSDCACNERLRRAASAIAADPSRTSELRALAEATAASMAVLVCK